VAPVVAKMLDNFVQVGHSLFYLPYYLSCCLFCCLPYCLPCSL